VLFRSVRDEVVNSLRRFGVADQVRVVTEGITASDLQMISLASLTSSAGDLSPQAPFVAIWSVGSASVEAENRLKSRGYSKLDGIPWLYQKRS